jgi:AsmA protein
MNKYLKYSLLGIGGLIALLLLVIAVIAATFNPNDYKQQIIDIVKEKKQRTLTIEGDIKLAFWPKIGANLGKISLSDFQKTSEFAAVDNVKVYLALLPLLKKELIVDTVTIDGARANIVKFKDGTTNFDDLLSKDEEESEKVKFDIDGVHVKNSALNYLDEASGGKYSISKLNLTTGHVALAQPLDLKTDFFVSANQPEVAAQVNIKGSFLADPDNQHFFAKALDASIQGSLADIKEANVQLNGDVDAQLKTKEFLVDGLKLVASGVKDGAKLEANISAPHLKALTDTVTSDKMTVALQQTKGSDNFKANLVLADIKGSPKQLQSSGITGDITGVQGQRTINGNFSSPFNGNLENLVFDLPKLAGNLDIKDPSLPNGAVKGDFHLSLHADVKQEQVTSAFDLNVDTTKLKGDVGVAGFKTPLVKFNLNADTLDLNKLLGKPSAKPVTTEKSTAAKPADLSALKTLFLDGKINIGQLLYDKYRLSGLNVNINANGEKLTLSGLNVKFDDSQIKGNFGISQFAKPLYSFDIDIDALDVDEYVSKTEAAPSKSTESKPADLSALKALNADGSIRIGHLKYRKTNVRNMRIDLKADGEKLNVNPFSAKVDDSQINANVGISRFSDPIYSFNVIVDKLDADKYITKSDEPQAKSTGDAPIDLSALKKLNASGEAKIGWLKLANVKTENVTIGLKAADGIATVSPFSANLYQGSMNGLLKVDARATPNITFKQDMKGIAIGPLLVDAINNDMLSGKGNLSVDVNTQGNTVGALKKALAGNAAMNLADGAIKGIDIAGTVRDVKGKLNVLKSGSNADSDKSKKTDFSELTGTFVIKNGVAHNEDLAMKAPIFRLTKGESKGDIDIGNEKIDYTAKPTIVGTTKGQGGKEADQLTGVSLPIKITGTFANPKFGMDLAAFGAALAKSNLLDNVGGEKAEAVKGLLGDGNKVEAIGNLLGKKKSDSATTTENTTAEEPKKKSKDKTEKKLKELLNF